MDNDTSPPRITDLEGHTIQLTGNHMVDDVIQFHAKFGLPIPACYYGRERQEDGSFKIVSPYATQPRFLPHEIAEFRQKCHLEELAEYEAAEEAGQLPDCADALLDLIYFAIGTLLFHGFPVDKGWNRIQFANMAKIRGCAKTSKRGSDYDVIKPEGWTAPNHTDLCEPTPITTYLVKIT